MGHGEHERPQPGRTTAQVPQPGEHLEEDLVGEAFRVLCPASQQVRLHGRGQGAVDDAERVLITACGIRQHVLRELLRHPARRALPVV